MPVTVKPNCDLGNVQLTYSDWLLGMSELCQLQALQLPKEPGLMAGLPEGRHLHRCQLEQAALTQARSHQSLLAFGPSFRVAVDSSVDSSTDLASL